MTLLVSLLLLPFASVTLYFAVEVFAGLKPIRATSSQATTPRSVIIVPAHDEDRIISATMNALIHAAAGRAAILVVADNCSDGTAASVRALGIEVIERCDPSRRGKGFALDFAMRHLRADPPEVILVIDADCQTEGPSIEALIRAVSLSGKPAQAIYLFEPKPLASPLVQISNFAFCVKNLVRQRGLQRLAGRVQLTGTGMAFPWSLFAGANLATASIVEDLQLGLELAKSGHSPQLVPEALVWSSSAEDKGTLVQRARWEGGFISTAKNVAPAALGHALKSLDLRGTIAAVHLLVPPIELLILLDLSILIVTCFLTWVMHASWLPALIAAAIVALMFLAVMCAWFAQGRAFVPAQTLFKAPIYILQKLGIYIRLARRGAPAEWIRTKRPRD